MHFSFLFGGIGLEIIKIIFVCLLAGAGAGIGTGFAGMSAAAVISPMLITFLDMPAYDAVGIALASTCSPVRQAHGHIKRIKT